MKGFSLWWVDWRIAAKAMARETLGRFLLFYLLGALFLGLLLSGGLNRFLSDRWTVSAILRMTVTPAEGKGIEGKVAALPGVLNAVYKDPEVSWKEFLAAYPGLETLRSAGGNPLPGYVEVRMAPARFTERDIRAVEAALRPLPQVERILSGGEGLPHLLKVKAWANALFWTGFGVLCAVSLAIVVLQEKSRAAALGPGFAFLGERGVSSRRIAASRAAAAAAVGGLVVAAALASAAGSLVLLVRRMPILLSVIGPPEAFLDPRVVVLAGAFVFSAMLLLGGASLWGSRAGRPARG